MFVTLMDVNMKKGIKYAENTVFFKALGDENRLKIMNLLNCGEICACEILQELDITQSTLSHHMKILCDCSLVSYRRAGKWTFYSLNEAAVKVLKEFVNSITKRKKSNSNKTIRGVCE